MALHMGSPGSDERMEVLLVGDYRHQLSVVKAPPALGSQPDFEAVQARLLIMERAGWQVGTVRRTVGFKGVVIALSRKVTLKAHRWLHLYPLCSCR